jgi:hypothetical protein
VFRPHPGVNPGQALGYRSSELIRVNLSQLNILFYKKIKMILFFF